MSRVHSYSMRHENQISFENDRSARQIIHLNTPHVMPQHLGNFPKGQNMAGGTQSFQSDIRPYRIYGKVFLKYSLLIKLYLTLLLARVTDELEVETQKIS